MGSLMDAPWEQYYSGASIVRRFKCEYGPESLDAECSQWLVNAIDTVLTEATRQTWEEAAKYCDSIRPQADQLGIVIQCATEFRHRAAALRAEAP